MFLLPLLSRAFFCVVETRRLAFPFFIPYQIHSLAARVCPLQPKMSSEHAFPKWKERFYFYTESERSLVFGHDGIYVYTMYEVYVEVQSHSPKPRFPTDMFSLEQKSCEVEKFLKSHLCKLGVMLRFLHTRVVFNLSHLADVFYSL